MRLKIRCPNAECRKVLVVDDKLAGRKGKCSTCGSKFVIPAPKPPATPQAAAPKAPAPAKVKQPSGEGSKAAAPVPPAAGRKPAGPSAASAERRTPIPQPGRPDRPVRPGKPKPPSRSAGPAGSAGAAATRPQRPKRLAADDDVISADELSDFLIEDDDTDGAEDFEDYEDYEVADTSAEDYEVDDFDDFGPSPARGKRTPKARDDFDDFEDYDEDDEFGGTDDYDDDDDEPPRRSGGRAGGSRGTGGRRASSGGLGKAGAAKAGTGVLLLQIPAYVYLVTVGLTFLSGLMGLLGNFVPLLRTLFALMTGLVTLLATLGYLACLLGWFCSAIGYCYTMQASNRSGPRGQSIVCLAAVGGRILLFFALVAFMISTLTERSSLTPSMQVQELMQAGLTVLLIGFLLYATMAVEVILCPIMLGSLNESANRGRTAADARTVRNLGIVVAATPVVAALILFIMAKLQMSPVLVAMLFGVMLIAASVITFLYLLRLTALMSATRDNLG